MVHGQHFSEQLKATFAAAAGELGTDDKALKKAMRAAGDHARMMAQVRSIPARNLPDIAEGAIRDMLASELSP